MNNSDLNDFLSRSVELFNVLLPYFLVTAGLALGIATLRVTSQRLKFTGEIPVKIPVSRILDRIEASCNLRGLIFDDLASQMGMSPEQLRKTKLDESQMIILSNKLSVTTDYLLSLTDSPEYHITEADLSPDERKFIEDVRFHQYSRLTRIVAAIVRRMPTEAQEAFLSEARRIAKRENHE